MPACGVGFAVDGKVDAAVRRAMDGGGSGSSRIDLALQAGVGPTGFTSSRAGRACGAQSMESDAGSLDR